MSEHVIHSFLCRTRHVIVSRVNNTHNPSPPALFLLKLFHASLSASHYVRTRPFQPATTGRDARSDVGFDAGFGVARHRLAGVHLETVDASAQVGDQAKVCWCSTWHANVGRS